MSETKKTLCAVTPNTLQEKLRQAIALHQNGDLTTAKILYENILCLQPEQVDALHLLGVIALQCQDYSQAIHLIDKAISLAPNNAAFYSNRGLVLQELKRPEAAIASYDKAISINPNYADAYCNRGGALCDINQLENAIASYDKAIAIKSDHADAHYNRGCALHSLGQLQAALASYDRAIVIQPNHANAYCNRGNVLRTLEQPEQALASYDQAISFEPNHAEAFYNRANALAELNQLDAAIASYNRAITIKPDYIEARCNLGNTLYELNQLEIALSIYEQAIASKPENAYAHYNKGLILLLQGDFAQGWKLYEHRWRVERDGPIPRQFPQPLWLGDQPIDGKTILLHSEQGFGDTIQFCRYAKLVSALGAHVIMEVPGPLFSLLSGLQGVSQIVKLGQKLPDFDYHCPLLSLPLAFKSTLNNIPSSSAYLQVDPQKKAFWQRQLGAKTRPRIGLAWSGNRIHKRDRSRSLKLAALLEYLPDGYQYVCLQKELRDVDQPILADNKNILFLGEQLTDFSDTAALCELMDLVVTVDTGVAHLAGALGKETWILLPLVPDWRWLLERNDSPWYPTVRLYRQSTYYNWESVLQKLQIDLLARVDLT